MRIGQLFQISLAAKCRLLFGLAVIVIIATALLVPWLYMGIVVRELNVKVAKEAALAVQSSYQLATRDWAAAQNDLTEAWPSISRRLGLLRNPPRLLYVGGCPREIPQYWDEFERRAVQQLCEAPEAIEAQQIENVPGYGRVTHYALAIRDPSIEDDQANFLGIIVVTMTAQEIWNYNNLYQLVIGGAALLAGALAIVVFYLITQYLILSPVRDLKGVAKRIVSGETNLRSNIETGDEFAELGDAFNEMLAHLNESQQELQKMNVSLDAKLGKLAETNVSLFEANRLKTDFLANISHELRTPLTSIVGFAELLRDATDSPKSADPKKIKRFCNNILTSGRMLLDLINNLLDLAKIEAGKMELHLTKFPISDVCEAVVDFTRPLADKKKLHVRLTLPKNAPVMRSDSGKIQQIIYNLMSNAIKFTPRGGRIDLSVEADDKGFAVFRVQDNGPGIPHDLQERVFEKFQQVDSSVTREYEGTGLGLPISRDLAIMLGGSLTMRSDEGQGTEFTVRLPISGPPESVPAAPATEVSNRTR